MPRPGSAWPRHRWVLRERIVVMDVDHENPRKQVYKLINPVITQAEGEVVWEEGCLSVVDFTAEVRRAAQVEVVALDEHEKELKIAAEGLARGCTATRNRSSRWKAIYRPHQPFEARSLHPQAQRKCSRSGTEPPKEGTRVMI